MGNLGEITASFVNTLAKVTRQSPQKLKPALKTYISQTGARCFAHPIPELCSTATVTHASDLEGYTDSYPFLPIPMQHAGFGVLVHGTLFQGYLECIQPHRAATKATMDNGTTLLLRPVCDTHHNIGSTHACRYDRRPDALYVLMTYLGISSSDRIYVNKAYYYKSVTLRNNDSFQNIYIIVSG